MTVMTMSMTMTMAVSVATDDVWLADRCRKRWRQDGSACKSEYSDGGANCRHDFALTSDKQVTSEKSRHDRGREVKAFVNKCVAHKPTRLKLQGKSYHSISFFPLVEFASG